MHSREVFTGTILIVAHHGNHVHIIHDCSYSNNSIYRRYSRRIVPSWKFTIQHWINLSIYFQKVSREYIYYNIAGRTIRFFDDLPEAKDRLMEGSELSTFDFHSAITCGSELQGDNENSVIRDQKSGTQCQVQARSRLQWQHHRAKPSI